MMRHHQLRHLKGSETLFTGDTFAAAAHLAAVRHQTRVDHLGVNLVCKGAVHGVALFRVEHILHIE